MTNLLDESKNKIAPKKLQDDFIHDIMTNMRFQYEFLENYLPAAMKEDLDWDNIQILTLQSKKEEYFQHNADLIFELHTQELMYFYLLLEHQSMPKTQILDRLVKYQFQIWRRHFKKSGSCQFPYIHIMILYTGKDVHNYSLALKEMLDGPAELVKKLKNEPFDLIDLRQHDFERMAHYARLGTK